MPATCSIAKVQTLVVKTARRQSDATVFFRAEVAVADVVLNIALPSRLAVVHGETKNLSDGAQHSVTAVLLCATTVWGCGKCGPARPLDRDCRRHHRGWPPCPWYVDAAVVGEIIWVQLLCRKMCSGQQEMLTLRKMVRLLCLAGLQQRRAHHVCRKRIGPTRNMRVEMCCTTPLLKQRICISAFEKPCLHEDVLVRSTFYMRRTVLDPLHRPSPHRPSSFSYLTSCSRHFTELPLQDWCGAAVRRSRERCHLCRPC